MFTDRVSSAVQCGKENSFENKIIFEKTTVFLLRCISSTKRSTTKMISPENSLPAPTPNDKVSTKGYTTENYIANPEVYGTLVRISVWKNAPNR